MMCREANVLKEVGVKGEYCWIPSQGYDMRERVAKEGTCHEACLERVRKKRSFNCRTLMDRDFSLAHNATYLHTCACDCPVFKKGELFTVDNHSRESPEKEKLQLPHTHGQGLLFGTQRHLPSHVCLRLSRVQEG